MSNEMQDWLHDERQEQARCATAAWCCTACGRKWGEVTSEIGTVHDGVCDVCGDEAYVWPVRAWGWLRRGITNAS